MERGNYGEIDMSTLAERLQETLKQQHLTAKELAEKAKISNGAMSLILNGNSTDIKFSTALNIAKSLHCDPIWLMTGIKSGRVDIYDDDDNVADGMVAIDQFHILLAGGSNAPEASYEEEHDSRPAWYHRSYFDRLGIDPKYCRRLQVCGDSMAPQINDGDWVLIYCKPGQRIIDGEIYGLWQAQEGLRVKRIRKPLKGGLIIHSDNPRYEDEYYDDSESCNFRLIGRVLERSGSVV